MLPLDLAKVEQLAGKGCSEEEIAAELGVSVDTLYRRKQKTVFAQALQRGRSIGRSRLRSAQYRVAIDEGNPTMLIWLGKQPGPCGLGQIDTSHVAHSGAITIEHDIAARLAAGRERLQGPEQAVIDVAAEDG